MRSKDIVFQNEREESDMKFSDCSWPIVQKALTMEMHGRFGIASAWSNTDNDALSHMFPSPPPAAAAAASSLLSSSNSPSTSTVRFCVAQYQYISSCWTPANNNININNTNIN
jgi:hypothetical protein